MRVEVVNESLHRCLIVHALVRLDGVVPVDKSDEFGLPMSTTLTLNLAVPHVHEGSDNAFSLSIGSWCPHLCEPLLDLDGSLCRWLVP